MRIDEIKQIAARAGVLVCKLSVAGAVIAAVAFAVVAFDGPTGEVSDAEADIWTVVAGDTSKHEDFVDVLEDEGMSEPRQFDHNGNQVYFSHDTTRESPMEVLDRYQRAFVREGVNRNYHEQVRDPVDPRDVENMETFYQGMAGMSDFMTGGLVPVETKRNRMTMVGIETPEQADNLEDLIVETDRGLADPEDVIGAFRYIDAEREEGSRETTVTAVWSDEYFDLDRLGAGNYDVETMHPIERHIPVCRGCERVTRFSGTGDEADQHGLLYRSSRPLDDVVSYYEEEMPRHGWREDPGLAGVAEMQRRSLAPSSRHGEVRSFINEDELQLTMIIYRDQYDGEVYVRMMTNQ